MQTVYKYANSFELIVYTYNLMTSALMTLQVDNDDFNCRLIDTSKVKHFHFVC